MLYTPDVICRRCRHAPLPLLTLRRCYADFSPCYATRYALLLAVTVSLPMRAMPSLLAVDLKYGIAAPLR